jgi:polar amino acid transport system substrate-binding protein
MVFGSTFARRTLKLLAWPLALSCAASHAHAADIDAYTEESPPYHYAENGKVAGISADRLRAACERARLSCSLRILPWARAMMMTKQQPNALLFSIVRTPDREKDFIWLSPIATEQVWIYGRPDSPPVHNIAELARTRIGIINGSSGVPFLLRAGIPRSAMDFANSMDGNLRKFAAHRIDFILSTDDRLAKALASHPLPFKVDKVLRMHDATSYYAMNLDSSPARVRAMQAALQELKKRDKPD